MKKRNLIKLSLGKKTVSNLALRAETIKGGISATACQKTRDCAPPRSLGCPVPTQPISDCCLSFYLSCICG